MFVYEKIFTELNKKKIQYVVIGGVALVLHGIVRLTADLDLVVALDKNNLKKFIDVMSKLGYKPRLPVKKEELMDERKRQEWVREKNMLVFSFINPKSSLGTVDIMVSEPIDFNQIREKSVQIKSANVKIPVASVNHLIELKKMSAREQDIADIEALKDIGKYE